jgi:hypothetical protein
MVKVVSQENVGQLNTMKFWGGSMINRSKSKGNDCLCDEMGGSAARNIRGCLEILLQQGTDLDIDDCESVQEWINAIFTELKSFPSEHLSFRLHCVHTGLSLLSISLDKAGEMEQQALAEQIVDFCPPGTRAATFLGSV